MLTLVKTNNYDYCYKLFLKYKYRPKIDRSEFNKLMDNFCYLMYEIFYSDVVGPLGVVFVQKNYNMFTLDGYRDDENYRKSNLKISTSYLAGKKVTDYMLENITNKLYSIHRIENRGADILCRKMGFKKENVFLDKETNNKFNIYVKEK